MSTRPLHKLSIVEVLPATGRRTSEETSSRKSTAKRSRRSAESTPARKQTAKKPKISAVRARAAKKAGFPQRTAPRQPLGESTVAAAIAPAPAIEMDLAFYAPEDPQTNVMVDEASDVLEPIAEAGVVEKVAEEEFAVECAVDPSAELLLPEPAVPEIDATTIPDLMPVTEALAPMEEPVVSVPVVEPTNIRRTFAFQRSAFLHVLARGWSWLQGRLKTQQSKKRLRVCESVSLGEKRFIAVVQVDGEQFLVGGSSSSVSTLAHLEQPREFADVFRRYGQSGMQA